MSIETTTTPPPEISSWNDRIYVFGFDGENFEEDSLDARIEQTLAGFGDPFDPSDPCSQFSCSAFWPLQ